MHALPWCALYSHNVRTELHEKCLSGYAANPKLPCHLCYSVDDLICKVLCRCEAVCKCGSDLQRSYDQLRVLIYFWCMYNIFPTRKAVGWQIQWKCVYVRSNNLERRERVIRVIWILHARACVAWIIFLDKILVRKKWDLYTFSNITFHFCEGIFQHKLCLNGMLYCYPVS